MESYPRVSTFKTAERFREHLARLGCDLPCDDEILAGQESPLGQPVEYRGGIIGNRWAIHPMEGWDGTEEGFPSDFTRRRWLHFGISGAKLIWGCEAVAVCHEGRANPNQLVISDRTAGSLESLLKGLRKAHRDLTGDDSDLYVGLQLTHSGRFCRPNRKDGPEPWIAYRHPLLDSKVGVTDDSRILTDAGIDKLIDYFADAARLASQAGFQFVDLKHCHGYLGHELLSAHARPGRYGGSFENRTRFLVNLVEAIRSQVPELDIGVRLSLFDLIPHRPDPDKTTRTHMGRGIPEEYPGEYPFGFGTDRRHPAQIDLAEGLAFVRLLRKLGIRLVNITAGSPYYVPHIQRPALFPPSDGYAPPEDPLVGVNRLLKGAAEVKRHYPDALVVGTGFTYLQEFLPHVAQAVVRQGWMDFAGIGRMVLSYPELPWDVMTSGKLDRKKICRTFSDCTTGPRKGLISGCYPLDPLYRDHELAAQLKELKKAARK